MTATIQSNLIDETLAGPYGALPLADFLHRNGKRWEGSDLPQNIKKSPAASALETLGI